MVAEPSALTEPRTDSAREAAPGPSRTAARQSGTLTPQPRAPQPPEVTRTPRLPGSPGTGTTPAGTGTGRAPTRAERLRALAERHRVPLIATLPTLPLYVVWWAFLATGGGDLAAQQAWAWFGSEHADSPYNLFWYGGTHTANYSLISPYLMAAVGVRTVTVLSGLVSAWLAALVIQRTGIRRPLGPAVLFSIALWCNVASGRTTFALGLAFAFAGMLALTGRRRDLGRAGLWALLATMASPVAGLFLAVAGAGWLLVRDWGRAAVLLIPPALVVAATSLLFPFKGEQPMAADRILPPVLFSLVLVAAAPRNWRVLRWGALVYAVGVVLTYFVSSPIGTNVERLLGLAVPSALLAALMVPGLDKVRRVALALSLVLSSTWLVQKTVDDLIVSTKVPAWAQHTEDVVAELERLGADRTRVEVVPARNHREATAFARHMNLARGWNRQLDVERGRLFYDGSFSPSAYRAWLDRWAVGYVVLLNGKPDGPAQKEAALVRSEPQWLERVWRDANWTVYQVRDAVPLASAPATVVDSTSTDMEIRMSEKGSATIRIAYSPWLRAEGACLRPHGEYTRLDVPAAGVYRIGSSWSRTAEPESCG